MECTKQTERESTVNVAGISAIKNEQNYLRVHEIGTHLFIYVTHTFVHPKYTLPCPEVDESNANPSRTRLVLTVPSNST